MAAAVLSAPGLRQASCGYAATKSDGWTQLSHTRRLPRQYAVAPNGNVVETEDGDPNAATSYSVGDSGPMLDQRRIVDSSCLELVRLGIEPANAPNILDTPRVVDPRLGVTTPHGEFWHRNTGDGYGEERDGGPWRTNLPLGSQETIGRLWPTSTGERGEYEVAAGHSAAARLATMAAAANDTGLLPEQVWDNNPPSGRLGFPPGSSTTSATPLAWSRAQFIRLAWSIAAGRVVEQPAVVASRYVRSCK